MANEEHLAILKQGVGVWNRWREENPDTDPDLTGADLSGANLCGAELWAVRLSGAILYDADLCEADLSGADLTAANLRYAKLTAANLSMANLTEADISYAHLREANLTRAVLTGAHFLESELNGADFSHAVLVDSVLANVNLSRVRGLNLSRHLGHSSIGVDTVYRSSGSIPETFLRGCGVPDQFIEYARSLVGKAIEYYSCFISYSSKDEECAQRLHADLQANNVRCWFAPHDMPIGARIRPAIDDAIWLHDKLLLLLSGTSVASQWVEAEVEHALEKERGNPGSTVLFPIRLDNAVMRAATGWASYLRNTRNVGDFTQWKDHSGYQKAFQRLLRDLKAAS